VIRFRPSPGYLRARHNGTPDDSHLNVQIVQRTALPRVDLTDVVGASQAVREYTGLPEDASASVIEIDGNIEPATAADVEELIWSHMHSHRHLRPDEIGTYLDGDRPRHSDPLALTQLVIAYQIVAVRDELGVLAGEPAVIMHRP
jgi:phosphoribulokinase